MKPISRILIALSSLSMIATFYLPLWQIQLWAPQYPEGLNMKIWHNHLSGAFDIINGLNHYIGMRLIKEEMFPELQYIGILIVIYIAIGLLASITNKLTILKIYTITGIVYGVAALYDFYRWGYDYGHNLDPHAAIQVPGMSYQPPVIGYKNLLNFTAYSGPDKGGWIIITASIVAFCVLIYTIWFNKKASKNNSIPSKVGMSVAPLLSIFLLSACHTSEPAPIRIGKDECTDCKMIITDPRFGAEIITKTNKLYKFDDVNCLNNFIKNNEKIQSQVNLIFIVDYGKETGFVLANQAYFLQSEELKSPMGSAVAAFSNKEHLIETAAHLTQSKSITWNEASKVY